MVSLSPISKFQHAIFDVTTCIQLKKCNSTDKCMSATSSWSNLYIASFQDIATSNPGKSARTGPFRITLSSQNILTFSKLLASYFAVTNFLCKCHIPLKYMFEYRVFYQLCLLLQFSLLFSFFLNRHTLTSCETGDFPTSLYLVPKITIFNTLHAQKQRRSQVWNSKNQDIYLTTKFELHNNLPFIPILLATSQMLSPLS